MEASYDDVDVPNVHCIVQTHGCMAHRWIMKPLSWLDRALAQVRENIQPRKGTSTKLLIQQILLPSNSHGCAVSQFLPKLRKMNEG